MLRSKLHNEAAVRQAAGEGRGLGTLLPNLTTPYYLSAWAACGAAALIRTSGCSIPRASAEKNKLLPQRKVVFTFHRYEPNTSADDHDV